MYLIPSVKNSISAPKSELKGCTFVFSDDVDQRLINLSKKALSCETTIIALE